MSVELCSQGCSKPAVAHLNGQPLCVACLTQLQNAANDTERNRLIYLQQLLAHQDYLEDQMAAAVGLPRLTPRMRLPQMPQNMVSTVNNTNIDRSTVGAINTGTVKSIDVHLQELDRAGGHEAAEALKKLAEAVLQDGSIHGAQKNEVLDQIAFLTEQASLAPEKRQKRAVIVPILEGLATTAKTITSLAGTWAAVHPILTSMFK